MSQIAFFVDSGLIVLFALTMALILYKVGDICFPRLVFRPSLEELSTRIGAVDAGDSKVAGLVVMGTIATAAPFLGLAGTVMHIIDALQSMEKAAVDITVISGPLATALYSTVWGLGSALPATIAYNLLVPHVTTQIEREIRKGRTSAQST